MEEKKSEILQSDKNKLIDILVLGILKSNVSEVSRATLFRIACASFFDSKNIQPFEIDQLMLEKIVEELNLLGKEKFQLDNKIIFRKKNNGQEETMHSRIVINEPDVSNGNKKVDSGLIKKKKYEVRTTSKYEIEKELDAYVHKKSFKQNRVKPISLNLSSITNVVNNLLSEDKYIFEENKIEVKTKSAIKNDFKSEIKLLTSSISVIELIKTIVVVYPKQIYTLNELKSYFINNFKRDPGNLITRELLIQTCIELHDEKKKYYLVAGDGNGLHLWKANSLLEWQKYGLGTVYAPTIQINDKKYDVRDFTLYVYDLLSKVKCVNSLMHRQENVTIKANNREGQLVTFNAYYCSTCNKYYTTVDVIEGKFPLKNHPFVRLNFECYSENYRRGESELMAYGYSVRADGPSEIERHNLLARLMTFDFLSKARIVSIIRDHINYNGRRANMENAVKKWQNDLNFVQNFNLSKQTTIQAGNTHIIYHGRRQ